MLPTVQLTKFTDYAFRVLMYADAANGELVTIDEITRAYGVSRAHLMKVVNALTQAGFLTAVRGRSGGLRLARPAKEISLGEIVRLTEPDFALVECFKPDSPCVITPSCKLYRILDSSFQKFLTDLDSYSLADISIDRSVFPVAG